MLAREAQKLGLLDVLDDAETGGDIGFEREQMQQPLAKSVDRLHL